jgi:hypothetical protein
MCVALRRQQAGGGRAVGGPKVLLPSGSKHACMGWQIAALTFQ